MRDKVKGAVIAGAVLAALAVGGATIAGAAPGTDDDKSDKPIAGIALHKAKAAALDHVGGGNVTETEAGDEEGAYEVEVTRAGGKQVDVHLDRGFNVLGQESDSESEKGDRN